MDPSLTLREASPKDIPALVRHRRLMFESMGFQDEKRNDAMEESVFGYLAEAMPGGSYRGWVATTAEGEIVAGLGLQVIGLPSHPRNLTGRYSYLMSLYVEPDYRQQGIARKLIESAITWSREQGIPEVRLHASDMGRPLYEQLGFRQTNEMRLLL
ncbi:MAG: GNAT family N-acetyltransferase [Chloroflexota bacterium]